MNSGTDTSQRKVVIVAGISFLFTLIIPTLSAVFIFFKLQVPENAAATANNIMANEFLFRIGIISDLIMSLNVIILSLAIYLILKTTNRNLALFALCVRLGDAILWGVAAVGSLIALLILNEKVYSTVFGTEQMQTLASLFLGIRDTMSSITFAFLGLGMTIFCYLFYRSKYIPSILAVFGIFSYILLLIYSFESILFPGYATVIQVFFWTPSIIFEPVVGLWLLFKGLKPETKS